MKDSFLVTLVLLGVMVVSSQGVGQFSGGPWLPSKHFDTQFNGDVFMDPTAGPWTENTPVTWRRAAGSATQTYDPNGVPGVVTWDYTDGECEKGIIIDLVASASSTFDSAVGYTIEWLVADNDGFCTNYPAYQVFIGGSDGRRFGCRYLDSGIYVWDTINGSGVIQPDGWDRFAWHTTRIAKPAGVDSSNWHLWIDGEYQGEVLMNDNGATWSFGDTSSSFGGSFKVDYLRYDTTGGWMLPDSAIVVEESPYPDGTTDVSEEGETTDTYLIGPAWGNLQAMTVTVTPSNSQVQLNGQAAGQALVLNFAAAADVYSPPAPQTVTVKAVDDAVEEGSHTVTLSHTSSSGDADFDQVTIADVLVTIEDNDARGIVLDPTSIDLDESDPCSVSYTVRLLSQPSSGDTTISIGNAGGQVTVDPASVVFTDVNWQDPKTVDVTVVDDGLSEGPMTVNIEHTGTGGGYDGAVLDPLVVNITDNEEYCGQPGTIYLDTDINEDCYVNLLDFGLFAADWLKCTDPFYPADCITE